MAAQLWKITIDRATVRNIYDFFEVIYTILNPILGLVVCVSIVFPASY